MKPKLVLLHGWGVNSRIWDDVLPSLSKHFDTVPIDLPGYGSRADQLPGEDLNQIAETVLSEAPETAIWCGWSLGGMVAMAAAIQQPQRINRLVLVCPTPKFMQDDQWIHGSTETAMQNLSDQFEANYGKALARFFLLQLGTAPDARTHSRELAQRVLRDPQPNWTTLNQGLNLLRSVDLRESLSNIDCPTDVIAGTEDRVIPSAAGQHIAHVIPGSTFHEVNAGHIPFVTSADWFVDLLERISGVKT